MVTVAVLLASAETAHFHQTNWSTVAFATFVPETWAQALPPLLSVGRAGKVEVAVVAFPASWTSSRSFAFTVAGIVSVKVPDPAVLEAVTFVRYAPGSIVYGSGSFESSSESVRYCRPFVVRSLQRAPFGVTSRPRASRIFTGGIETGIRRS